MCLMLSVNSCLVVVYNMMGNFANASAVWDLGNSNLGFR